MRERLEHRHVNDAHQQTADALLDALPGDVEQHVFQVEVLGEINVHDRRHEVNEDAAGETDSRSAEQRVLGDLVEQFHRERSSHEEADQQVHDGRRGKVDAERVRDELVIVEEKPMPAIGKTEHAEGRHEPADNEPFSESAHDNSAQIYEKPCQRVAAAD